VDGTAHRPLRRVYLAGPEVFLPDAGEVLAEKKRLCEAAGLVGLSPLDTAPPSVGEGGEAAARRIYDGNRDAMCEADCAIANITPFRGVSVDPGTAFEIGFLCAAGRPVFAYTFEPRDHAERVAQHAPNNPAVAAHTGQGWTTEDFGLAENLMIALGVEDSGGRLLRPETASTADPFRNLALFRACLELVLVRNGEARPGQ
jgi:nucleoside 2-deoxyribosyltransferase